MSESAITMPAPEFRQIAKLALDRIAPEAEAHKEAYSKWSSKLCRVQMYLLKRGQRKVSLGYPFMSFPKIWPPEFYPSRPREPYGYSKLSEIKSLVNGAAVSENASVTFTAEIGQVIRHWVDRSEFTRREPLEDTDIAVLGGAMVRLKSFDDCELCDGRGSLGFRDICPSCGGTGRVRV